MSELDTPSLTAFLIDFARLLDKDKVSAPDEAAALLAGFIATPRANEVLDCLLEEQTHEANIGFSDLELKKLKHFLTSAAINKGSQKNKNPFGRSRAVSLSDKEKQDLANSLLARLDPILLAPTEAEVSTPTALAPIALASSVVLATHTKTGISRETIWGRYFAIEGAALAYSEELENPNWDKEREFFAALLGLEGRSWEVTNYVYGRSDEYRTLSSSQLKRIRSKLALLRKEQNLSEAQARARSISRGADPEWNLNAFQQI